MSSLRLALLSYLLACFLALAKVQPDAMIDMGSEITATKSGSAASWTSASGRFAFGFYPVEAEYAIGVWIVISATVIWTADRDGKLLPEKTKLKLTDDGLQIQSTDGDRSVGKLPEGGAKIQSASMKDYGNFVIIDVNNQIMWQTFDYPTDTLIAGQILRMGNKLVSNVSPTNHSSGRFQVVMQQDSNLVSYPVNTPLISAHAYWASHTDGDGYTSVQFDSNGHMDFITDVNVTHINYIEESSHTFYSRIDPDGYLRAYDTNSGSTELVDERPDGGKCSIKGACGSNSYCIYIDAAGNTSSVLLQGEAVCVCFPGFVYTDESKQYMGCQRNFSMGQCANITYSITKLANLSFSDDSYNYTNVGTEEDCHDSCLRDCNCYAALFADKRCSKQRYPLLYAMRDDYPDYPTVTFLKVGTELELPPRPPPQENIDRFPSDKFLIVSVVTACTSFLAFSAFFLFLYINNSPSYRKKCKEMEISLAGGMVPRSFTYKQLEKATNNFSDSNFLGKGGFSTVYWGHLKLESEETLPIAVKQLDKQLLKENEKGFRTEMKAAGGAHHRNLVRLLGFCHEGTKWLLVYEYMNRGSLEAILFPQEAPTPHFAPEEAPRLAKADNAWRSWKKKSPPAPEACHIARSEKAWPSWKKKRLPEHQASQGALNEAQAPHVAKEADKDRPSWKERASMAMDVARGILYLHEGLESVIIHSDIKPANVLVAHDFTAKIGDLGLAKLLNPHHTSAYSGAAGTGYYIAPEWVAGTEALSPLLDVYSFGILLLELITCRKFEQIGAANGECYLSQWAYKCLMNSTLEQLVPGGEEADMDELKKLVMVALWCVQKSHKNRKSMKEVVYMLGGKKLITIPPDNVVKLGT